jgi:hypothetical protein
VLPTGEIYRAATRTAGRYPWRILAVSVAVAALSTLVEFGVAHLIDEGNWAEALFGSACLTGSSMLGSVFLSGRSARACWRPDRPAAGGGVLPAHRRGARRCGYRVNRAAVA